MRFARQLLSQHWSQAIILKGSMRGIGPTARTSGNFDKARHQLDINTRLPLAVNWLADLLVAKLSPSDFHSENMEYSESERPSPDLRDYKRYVLYKPTFRLWSHNVFYSISIFRRILSFRSPALHEELVLLVWRTFSHTRDVLSQAMTMMEKPLS